MGFACQRPLFRVATGLIPGSVWRTSFGQDRAGLIGHKLNPDKLQAKIPRNLASLDLQLSIIEPQLAHGGWLFSAQRPSLADISWFYQLDWACQISAGQGLGNLTGGAISDGNAPVITSVFNETRYPNLWSWFHRFRDLIDELPLTEARSSPESLEAITKILTVPKQARMPALLPTPVPQNCELDKTIGLDIGTEVSIAPDDTGRGDPTVGRLVALSTEEVVVNPRSLPEAQILAVDIRLHFPRLGFVVRPTSNAKL